MQKHPSSLAGHLPGEPFAPNTPAAGLVPIHTARMVLQWGGTASSPGGGRSPIAPTAPSPGPDPWSTRFPYQQRAGGYGAGGAWGHPAPTSSTRQHPWVWRKPGERWWVAQPGGADRLGCGCRRRAGNIILTRGAAGGAQPCRDLPRGQRGSTENQQLSSGSSSPFCAALLNADGKHRALLN